MKAKKIEYSMFERAEYATDDYVRSYRFYSYDYEGSYYMSLIGEMGIVYTYNIVENTILLFNEPCKVKLIYPTQEFKNIRKSLIKKYITELKKKIALLEREIK